MNGKGFAKILRLQCHLHRSGSLGSLGLQGNEAVAKDNKVIWKDVVVYGII